MNEIVISNLSKNYGEVEALKNVSLRIEENKIYGLLGRNGAGKSTLLNIIANRIFADSGTVTINGESNIENDKALQQIYYMSEKSFYPDSMRVIDVFKSAESFNSKFDFEMAKGIAAEFQLDCSKKIKTLSTGYSTIFKITMALSFDLPYILLDEPVLGLDAYHRELFYKILIKNYVEYPKTYIISTHLIEEVSSIVEDVIIIKEGEIIKESKADELLSYGYAINGKAVDVDRFTEGKNVIGIETIGVFKIAYIIGDPREASNAENLEVTNLDLQKLFIELTN